MLATIRVLDAQDVEEVVDWAQATARVEQTFFCLYVEHQENGRPTRSSATDDRPLPPYPFAPDASTPFDFRFTPDDVRQGYSVQCDECEDEFGFVSYAWCREAYAESETPLWLMPPHSC